MKHCLPKYSANSMSKAKQKKIQMQSPSYRKLEVNQGPVVTQYGGFLQQQQTDLRILGARL